MNREFILKAFTALNSLKKAEAVTGPSDGIFGNNCDSIFWQIQASVLMVPFLAN